MTGDVVEVDMEVGNVRVHWSNEGCLVDYMAYFGTSWEK